MSRRAALQHRPACREWQGPGFQFLPLDEHGAAIWPPGYVPLAAGRMPTAAQTEARMQQHERVAEDRARARGWAGNTFDMANTPTMPAPKMMAAPAAPLREPPPPGGKAWRVAPDSHIWRVLTRLRRYGRPLTMGEVADAIGTTRNIARASMQAWLERKVLLLVVPQRDVPPQTGHHPPRDFALGPNVAAVRVRAYA